MLKNLLSGGLILVVCCVVSVRPAISEESFSRWVDAAGTISFPASFRTSMIHLGSWFVPAGGASGFHDVYTQPGVIESFRENGVFPDGAVIVKELRASEPGDYTTGQGVHHATGDLKQWFVMVKDSNNRFQDNKLWGDGWGWALFKPDNPAVNAATDYKADCLGCHIPAKETDWIYTEAYPVLAE